MKVKAVKPGHYFESNGDIFLKVHRGSLERLDKSKEYGFNSEGLLRVFYPDKEVSLVLKDSFDSNIKYVVVGVDGFAFLDTSNNTFITFNGRQCWVWVEEFVKDYEGNNLESFLKRIPDNDFQNRGIVLIVYLGRIFYIKPEKLTQSYDAYRIEAECCGKQLSFELSKITYWRELN